MPVDVIMEKDEDETWGFQLTGGVTFDMPITVFEVEEGGHAEEAGIRLGDVLQVINDKETDSMTLEEALDLIESSKEVLNLTVNNLEDQEAANPGLYGDNFRVDVSTLDLKPPMPLPEPELAKRKCWHPIMLDTNPAPVIVESTGYEEAPHKKILRDFRESMRNRNRPMKASPEVRSLRQRSRPIQTEEYDDCDSEMNMEEQLRNMQKQLAALSSLPAYLEKTLKTVTQRINRLLPANETPEPEEVEPLIYEEEDYEDEQYEVEDEDEYEYEKYSYADDQEEEEYVKEYTTREEDVSEVDRTLETVSEEVLEDISEAQEETEPEEEEPESESEQEPEEEREPTIEELERMEKLKKMENLNRAWPWGNEAKPVYKISERYEIPRSQLFSSRIQSMERKMEKLNPVRMRES